MRSKQKMLCTSLTGSTQEMLGTTSMDNDDDNYHHHHYHDYNSLQILI